MSSFLEQIENEFSRGREMPSRLSPLDWNLAQTWETRGIPLSLVLRAMGDVFKQNAVANQPKSIGTLRYFIPAVEKAFAGWQASQVGKANHEAAQNVAVGGTVTTQYLATEKNYMQNSSFAASIAYLNENIEILDNLQTILRPIAVALPELLQSAVVQTRSEILALINDAQAKQFSSDKIEAHLTELRAHLEIALIASVSDEERAKIIADVKTEYGKFHLLKDVEQKVLIRKLYNRYGLPELTLYAF